MSQWAPGWEDGTARLTTTTAKRAARLRCLGNAVVPAVAEHVARVLLARFPLSDP